MEYCNYCIPPLILSGDGIIFMPSPMKKEENTMSEENLYTFDSPEYRKTFWHTSSHIMAQAV